MVIWRVNNISAIIVFASKLQKISLSCYNLLTNQPISPRQACENHSSSGQVKKTGLKVRGCGTGFPTHNPEVLGSNPSPAT
jgi:hypothetical protein